MYDWKKSSHSSGGDNCVEVMRDMDGNTAVRHSKDGVHTLLFTGNEWDAFLAGVKDGEFN